MGITIFWSYLFYRLGRKLVKEGLADFTVKIGNEEIKSVKIIFIGGNKTFRKLLEDEKFFGTLELADGCSCRGFLLLEKYYSIGEMEITLENVCEVLLISICYNDEYIRDMCNEYIKKNYNDEIIIKLVQMINKFDNVMKDLEEMVCIEFEKRGYKYLYNGIIFI